MSFYGAALAAVHHEGFADFARAAADYVVDRLHEAGFRSGRVTDLGCGSGILLERAVAAGFDAAGTDISSEMIDLARDLVPAADLSVGSVYDYAPRPSVAIAAVGEVFNYLAAPAGPGPGSLAALLARMRDALEPGGLLVFDVLEDRGRDNGSLVTSSRHEGPDWTVTSDASLSADGSVLTRDIVSEVDGSSPVRETHRLRLLDLDEMLDLVREVGFSVEALPGYAEFVLPGPRSVVHATVGRAGAGAG